MAEDLVDELVNSYLFSELSKKHLKAVAKIAEVREVPKGETLVREGTYSREFFMVLDGTAEITVRGKPRSAVGRGEFFGELAILNHAERSATVTANTPMRLAVIDAKDLESLLQSEPVITFHMLVVLARRMQDVVTAPLGKAM